MFGVANVGLWEVGQHDAGPFLDNQVGVDIIPLQLTWRDVGREKRINAAVGEGDTAVRVGHSAAMPVAQVRNLYSGLFM